MGFTTTPSLETKCSACQHKLSEHYTTHDGTKDGCSHFTPAGGDQRDGWDASTCQCKGFAMTYRPIRPSDSTYPSSLAYQRGDAYEQRTASASDYYSR